MDEIEKQARKQQSTEYAGATVHEPGSEPEAKGRAKKGCFSGMGLCGCSLIGCGSLIVFLFIFGMAGFNFLREKILTTQPLDIQPVTLNYKEESALGWKIAPIKIAIDQSAKKKFKISLNEREVNYLIGRGATLDDVRAFVELRGNEMAFKASIKGKDSNQHVNITGVGNPVAVDYVFNLKLKKVRVGKYDLPPSVASGFSDFISETIKQSEERSAAPVRVKTMEILDGKAVVELETTGNPMPESTVEAPLPPEKPGSGQ